MTNKEKFNEVFKETFGYTPEDCFPCPEKCPEEFVDSCCDACPYARFAKKEYKKPDKDLNQFEEKVIKILTNLNDTLIEYSPIPEHEINTLICVFMDLITDDDSSPETDLLCVRHDMAEKIFKEWPHSIEYYRREKKE